MPAATTLKHYQRALARWPKDALRPDVSFSKVMQTRVERRYLPNHQISDSTKPPTEALSPRLDDAVELEQANALFSFLENRYAKKYPLSNHLMKPASNPQYYENIKRELEEAPKRSWIGRFINSWKGSMRYS